jgi:hypothetical protein
MRLKPKFFWVVEKFFFKQLIRGLFTKDVDIIVSRITYPAVLVSTSNCIGYVKKVHPTERVWV